MEVLQLPCSRSQLTTPLTDISEQKTQLNSYCRDFQDQGYLTRTSYSPPTSYLHWTISWSVYSTQSQSQAATEIDLVLTGVVQVYCILFYCFLLYLFIYFNIIIILLGHAVT
jgi:hypothetical protein